MTYDKPSPNKAISTRRDERRGHSTNLWPLPNLRNTKRGDIRQISKGPQKNFISLTTRRDEGRGHTTNLQAPTTSQEKGSGGGGIRQTPRAVTSPSQYEHGIKLYVSRLDAPQTLQVRRKGTHGNFAGLSQNPCNTKGRSEGTYGKPLSPYQITGPRKRGGQMTNL